MMWELTHMVMAQQNRLTCCLQARKAGKAAMLSSPVGCWWSSRLRTGSSEVQVHPVIQSIWVVNKLEGAHHAG